MDNNQTVFVIDDDEGVRDSIGLLLDTIGQEYKLCASAQNFINSYKKNQRGCIILDIRMPRMTGLDLQKILIQQHITLPIIFITGHGDIPMAVEAMRNGAIDFIRKPFREQDLIDRINEALQLDESYQNNEITQQHIHNQLEKLSTREYEIFERVAKGEMNKVIAQEIGISERTVEVHRSQVMKKLGLRTVAQLVKFKIDSESTEKLPVKNNI